jgi:hypothetical protein
MGKWAMGNKTSANMMGKLSLDTDVSQYEKMEILLVDGDNLSQEILVFSQCAALM